MLVITIDLWPHGDRTRSQELGRAYLWNDGTGDTTRGNYSGAVMRKGETNTPHHGGRVVKMARIEDYPRLAYPVWELIRRFLNDAFRKSDA